MKILIVDDSESMARAIESLVTQMGHSVVKAKNGLEALCLFKHEAPDLIFMDIDMPELDGYKASQMIRAHATTPILFLSSHSSIFDQTKAELAGGSGFIQKPFSKSVILKALEGF